METFSFFAIWMILIWACTSNAGQGRSSKNIIPHTKDSINFVKQVQPILIKNCSPCHFPGGKLYEELPFDKEISIVNHIDKLLKRIKKSDEAALILEYSNQFKNG